MPNPIKAAICADDYSQACTIQSVYHGNGGSYNVTGQAVFYQVQYSTDANVGDETWTDEIYLNPGAGSIDKGAIGVRFRNAIAGSQATVSAYINPPGRPGLNISSSSAASGAQNLVPTDLVNFPPSAPSDGDLVVLVLPSTYDPVGGKQIRWLCSYNAADAVWDVIGGAPLLAIIATSESTSSVAYVDLATPGPSITIPRPGDYIAIVEALYDNITNAQIRGWMAYQGAGIAAATDADAGSTQDAGAAGSHFSTLVARREKVALTTATPLTAKYRSSGASSTFANRILSIIPIRIS